MRIAHLLNTAWMISCTREAMAYSRSTREVAETQSRILQDLIQQNRDTEFGRAHGFAGIGDVGEFRRRVPVSTYEDLAPYIQRIADAKLHVLTREPVKLLEPTSGTTSGEKLIPYTASLRRQFQRAVRSWMHDLLRHRPAIRSGRAYWSISPAMSLRRRSQGGIPIGFDDDADYLSGIDRWLIARLLVTPSELTQVPEMESFRYCTLLHLLRADDLSLISVWSPTFLTALLSQLGAWQERLCDDLENGTLNPSAALPRGFATRLGQTSRTTRARAHAVREALRSSEPIARKLQQLWPRLSLISCWADAGAARYVEQVRDLFPHVEIQPKGLLATEGCVSFPLLDRKGAVLAIRSHFLEFVEFDAPDRIRLAHELELGGRYRPMLTTGGGLYRYALGDIVEVCGFEHQCPLVTLFGKSDYVCDLVGEKLAEPHVRSVVSRVLERRSLATTFYLMAPMTVHPPRYRLYLQLPSKACDEFLREEIGRDFEAGLSENPHYAYARQLQQLAAMEIRFIDPAVNAWGLYERQKLAQGMRAGNIKPLALDRSADWSAIFESACELGQRG